MAARKGGLTIRGPSSPDLGQERPADRLRPGSIVDLGIRDDAAPGASARTTASVVTRR
jgi:hypothetical protein